MNEIEKMYKKAGIKKKYCGWLDMGDLEPELKYPEFTAEKQLKIEGVIFRHNFGIWECERLLGTEFDNGKFVKHYFVWHYMAQEDLDDEYIEYQNEDRAIALSGFINNLWGNLTEEEKEQIRGILK